MVSGGALIPPDAASPDAAIVAAAVQPLPASSRAFSAAIATAALVLSQRWSVFHLPHRRSLLALRARVRLMRHYGLAGSGIPLPPAAIAVAGAADAQLLLPSASASGIVAGAKGTQAASGAAARKGGPAASATPAAAKADAADGASPSPSAITDLLVGPEPTAGGAAPAAVPGSAAGTAAAEPASAAAALDSPAPPALLRALSLLSVPGHPGVSVAVQVSLGESSRGRARPKPPIPTPCSASHFAMPSTPSLRLPSSLRLARPRAWPTSLPGSPEPRSLTSCVPRVAAPSFRAA